MSKTWRLASGYGPLAWTLLLSAVLPLTLSGHVRAAEDGLEEHVQGQESTVEMSTVQREYLERLKADPFVKEHYGWKLAFCQHPMYLLVDEDRGVPTVGEREPPWGAPNSEEYVRRVERNLQSLDELSELRLNYQWSALEIHNMLRDYPHMRESMLKHYHNGKLDFIDGTFSQAHLQILSSESNWRQFEYGLQVYRDLLDKEVDIYSRQETGLHVQLPQLLKIFGYRFATIPGLFQGVVEFTDGSLEMAVTEGNFEALPGDEFFNGVALDGSSIPFYIYSFVFDDSPRIPRDLQQDPIDSPKLFVRFPDMEEIDRETFESYHGLFDWVILADALERRFAEAPPRADARIKSYWAYLDGMWGEELLRTMRVAEEDALLAEAMAAMAAANGAPVEHADALHKIWWNILKAQHHDIHWLEITDLRRKCINDMEATREESRDIMALAAEEIVRPSDGAMAVFNGLPTPRECLVELEQGEGLGTETGFQEFGQRSIGFAEAPPGGYASYSSAPPAPSVERALPERIETPHYTVDLTKQGLIRQLRPKQGAGLLQTDEYLGGEIRVRIQQEWHDNRSAACSYHTGPVYDVVQRSTSIGEVPVVERYFFFKSIPAIRAELDFEFDATEVGYAFIDKSKFNVYYPTSGAELYHDIPFGYVQARESRPLFAINWVYANGLVYVNRGNVKHWVDNGVLANVLAWGGTRFTNRTHWDWLDYQQYDLRLYGEHTFEYYLLPFGEFDGRRIAQQVAALTAPSYVCEGSGEKSFYALRDPSALVTAIYRKDDQLRARGVKLPGQRAPQNGDWKIFDEPAGDSVSVAPHE